MEKRIYCTGTVLVNVTLRLFSFTVEEGVLSALDTVLKRCPPLRLLFSWFLFLASTASTRCLYLYKVRRILSLNTVP